MTASTSSAPGVVRRGAGGWIARDAVAATSSRRATGHRNSSRCFPAAVTDLVRWRNTPRTRAAAVVLQLYGGLDPDHSRTIADRVVHAVDRAGKRGHGDGAPTDGEVRRLRRALARHSTELSFETAYEVLDAALTRGWGE
jgi:hypothetical protein